MTFSGDTKSISNGERENFEVCETVANGHHWVPGGQVWLLENLSSELCQLRGSCLSILPPRSLELGKDEKMVSDTMEKGTKSWEKL